MKSYKIYQVKKEFIEQISPLDFLCTSPQQKGCKIYLGTYEVVYIGELLNEGVPLEALDSIFETFNINQPSGYTGRSMSVTDVVELDGEYYYCASTGWINCTPQETFKQFKERINGERELLLRLINNMI